MKLPLFPRLAEDDMIEITPTTIDVQKIIETAHSADCGAVSVFLGTVRNHSRGKDVTSLEYDAYPAMAIKNSLSPKSKPPASTWPACSPRPTRALKWCWRGRIA